VRILDEVRILNLALRFAGSVVLGGLITWLCSKYYYQKASKELRKEAEELRRLNNLMLRGMELAGWVTLNKDEQGNIKGYKFILKAESGTITMKGSSVTLVKTSHKKED